MRHSREKGAALLATALVLVLAGLWLRRNGQEQFYWLLEAIGALVALAGVQVLYNRQSNSAIRPDSPVYEVSFGNKGYIEAEIMGITRDLRVDSQQKPVYRVLAKYQKRSKEVIFTGEALDEYPGKQLIGRKVRVYKDDSTPDGYRIDLSSAQ